MLITEVDCFCFICIKADKAVACKIFSLHINSGDLSVGVGGVIIHTVAAYAGVACDVELFVLHFAYATGDIYRAQYMEKL